MSVVSPLQDFHQGRRGRTHRALILAYSQIAVHAPQTQLLPRVERDITRRVLQHYVSSCQVGAWECSVVGTGLPWD